MRASRSSGTTDTRPCCLRAASATGGRRRFSPHSPRIVARSFRKRSSGSRTFGTLPVGTRASPVVARLVRSTPYQRMAASVASSFSVFGGCFIESPTRCQYCGSAIDRCSTTSVIVQLSGFIRKRSCASESPIPSFKLQIRNDAQHRNPTLEPELKFSRLGMWALELALAFGIGRGWDWGCGAWDLKTSPQNRCTSRSVARCTRISSGRS